MGFTARLLSPESVRPHRAAFGTMRRGDRCCYAATFETSGGGATSTQRFLVSQAMGGGAADAVAADADDRYGLRLVPFASVAAPRGFSIDGRAFCFLPLPVATRLPVHINGYFELSSNRRDIWQAGGDVLTGGARLRADWNAALLSSVAAPAYAALLEAAARESDATPADVYTLFPTFCPPDVWGGLVAALFALLPSMRVAHTAASGWAAPLSCLLPCDAASDESRGVGRALVAAGLPVWLSLPRTAAALFRSHAPPGAVASCGPPALRAALRRPGVTSRWAAGQPELGVSALGYCLSDVADVDADADADALAGLPLLPLASGDWVCFAAASDCTALPVHAPTAEEAALFEAASPGALLRRAALPPPLLSRVEAAAATRRLRLRPIDDAALASLLITILPPRSDDALRRLLARVGRCDSLLPFSELSLLPTNSGLRPPRHGAPLLAAGLDPAVASAVCCAGVATLTDGLPLPPALLEAVSFPATPRGVVDALMAAAAAPVVTDINAAADAAPRRSLGAASAAERRSLLRFILCASHHADALRGDGRDDARAAFVASLPLFEVFLNAAPASISQPRGPPPPPFSPLALPRPMLPPPHAPASLLHPAFLHAPCALSAAALSSPGCPPPLRLVAVPTLASLLLDHTLPPNSRWDALSRPDKCSVARVVLLSLATLRAEAPGAVESLSRTPFVPTADGGACPCINPFALFVSLCRSSRQPSIPLSQPPGFAAPCSLHNPRAPGLARLLPAASSFAAPPCDDDACAAPLSMLGCRDALSRGGVLDVARRVASSASAPLGAELMEYLDHNADRLLASGGEGEGGSGGDDASPVAAWLAALSDIAFCPVHIAPPEDGMPWPPPASSSSAAPPCVAAPADCRPPRDGWLCSSSRRLLRHPLGSRALSATLGWARPLPMAALAAQAAALGKQHARLDAADTRLAQALASAVPRLYTEMETWRGGDAAGGYAAEVAVLAAEPCVWVGGGFARPPLVALSGPVSLSPFRSVLPADLACFAALLRDLGVRDAFGPPDWEAVLSELSAEAGDGEPLSPPRLHLALWLLQQLAAAPHAPLSAGERLAPDAESVLRPASSLAFDDAPWLGGAAPPGVALCHPLLAPPTASAVGVRSLRAALLTDATTGVFDLRAAGVDGEGFGQREALTTRLRHSACRVANWKTSRLFSTAGSFQLTRASCRCPQSCRPTQTGLACCRS